MACYKSGIAHEGKGPDSANAYFADSAWPVFSDGAIG